MSKWIVVLVLFIGTGATAQHVLKGQIVDAHTQKGIPFSTVFFPDLQTGVLADSAGNVSFENPPVGRYKIRISASGFETQMVLFDADADTALNVALHHSHILLDHVIISGIEGLLQRESISNVESVRLTDLQAIPSATLGEAMSNIPGVYQSNLGPGISKPVVRGMSGPRVVSYLNGLRLENQQWGADHGMGVTDVGIGAVEVLRGPSSLLYGSDAIGGVIFFKDEAYANANEVKGYLSTRFDANSMGTTNRGGIQLNKKGIKVNAFGGMSNHADYGLPNGKYVGDSRFKETVGRLSLGYNRRKWMVNVRYSFLHQRIGLPGHTHDSIPDFSSFQRDAQARSANTPAQLIFNHYVSMENKFFFKRSQLSLILGNTNNHLQEYEEQFTIPEIEMKLNNTVYHLKFVKQLSDEIDVFMGAQGMYRLNRNDPAADEWLIPDANTFDVGLYAMISGRLGKWRYQAGGRYDYRNIDALQSVDFDALNRNFSAMNYAAGIARIDEHFTTRINVSTGFRAPTSSELLSDGIHHGSNRYEIGETNLSTEKALQVDASVELHFEHFELVFNPFYNTIKDYVHLLRQDSVINGFTVYEYQQLDQVHLVGGDLGFHYHPHFAHWLHLESAYSMIYSEDQDSRPISFIPQSRINTSLKFDFGMKSKFKFSNFVIQHVYRFEQYRPGDLESLTRASKVINLGLNMELDIKTPIELSVGVRNLFNESYYDHLSNLKSLGLVSPGLNIYGSLKLSF